MIVDVKMPCPRCSQPLGVFDWSCKACGTSAVDVATQQAPAPVPRPQATPPAPSPVAGPTCARCGQLNPAGVNFCGGCGAPLAAAPAAGTKPCPTCGVANPVAYKFCGACSARFP